MFFQNRPSAADLLAEKLRPYRREHPLILALPFAALEMGDVLARRLHGDLDALLVGRLLAPLKRSVTVGAVTELGDVFFHPNAARHRVSQEELVLMAESEVERLQNERARITPLKPLTNPRGRTVILVDDILITGSSMIAALRSVRALEPRRLIVAAAVATFDTAEELRALADDCVFLEETDTAFDLGTYFFEGEELDEQEAKALLNRSRDQRVPAKAAPSRPDSSPRPGTHQRDGRLRRGSSPADTSGERAHRRR